MYASLLMSLLAAFIAMLGKQWLNRYLRHAGGSMIERCGDRQRKYAGLEKWPFHLFVESLPVMLQIALLLACGLCRYMASISNPVAGVLISFTVLGVLFYLGIIVAGTTSYECPFQTPASTALRSLWARTKPHLIPVVLPIVATLCSMGAIVQYPIFRIAIHLPHFNLRHHFHVLSERVKPRILRVAALKIRRRSRHPPLPTIQENPSLATSQETFPWLTPNDLTTIRMTSANDVRCVSWILRSITDQEALDTAIRLASTVRWFEGGIDMEPPYDLIVSTFHACFGSDWKVYPGSRDRAYYSGRAILWIHALAMCKSEEFASTFPLPTTKHSTSAPDPDLEHLLEVNMASSADDRFVSLLSVDSECTPSYSQWISNVLLHLSWANRTPLDFQEIVWSGPETLPLDAMLNRLLAWCILLGSPVEEEVLKVQDKSYDISCFSSSSYLQCFFFASDRLERILYQLSDAIVSAISTAQPECKPIQDVLSDLTRLENCPWYLTEMAYEWCSMICKNRQRLEDWKSLLLLPLQVGFRHFDPQSQSIPARLTHAEHRRELVDVVFEWKDGEAIADLLCALTTMDYSHEPAYALLGICTGYLVDLYDQMDSPPRLRQLVIRSVGLIGYEGFKEVGVEKFILLLNHLHVGIEDVDDEFTWMILLVYIIQSPEGAQRLSNQSWEWLVKLVISGLWRVPSGFGHVAYSPQVVASLLEAQEWDRLEYCIGVIWMVWPPEISKAVEDLERVMVLLFRQRPGAAQKLKEWVEQWSQKCDEDIPESFQQVCKQAQEAAQRDALYAPFRTL